MKTPSTVSLSFALASFVLVASTIVAARVQDPSAPLQSSANVVVTDDPDYGLFALTCNKCHDAARIVAARRTKPDWQDLILKMIEKGATGSGKDFETVFGYVLRHYGKVYINSAAPDEITTVLGLSKKDAEAIVAFREARGEFPDFEAIAKVPDIDVKPLEAHKEAVEF